jgi:ribulose-phosphate 3-epimerase
MIVDPDKHYESFKAAGATGITIHVEATKDPASSLKKIRDLGLKAGITLKPATPISEVEPLLDICDLALIMTVNPGWSGQKFMPEGLKKIERLKQIISAKNLTTLIEVDGGINHDTARMCVSAGADVLVAGSYIFGASDRKAAINSLK